MCVRQMAVGGRGVKREDELEAWNQDAVVFWICPGVTESSFGRLARGQVLVPLMHLCLVRREGSGFVVMNLVASSWAVCLYRGGEGEERSKCTHTHTLTWRCLSNAWEWGQPGDSHSLLPG